MPRMSAQHQEILRIIKSQFPRVRIVNEYSLGQRLFLDIYIPDFHVGIEINGIQHYQYSEFFHDGDRGNFELGKMLDKKKRRLCADQGIFVYTVRYDEQFDINDFVNKISQHLKD